MRTGIGFPSYTSQAAITADGAWLTAYPVSNVMDLTKPTRVARAAGNVYVGARFVWPAAVPVQFIALVNHNLPAGGTWQVQLYSNTNPDGSTTGLIYESNTMQVWPSGGPVPGFVSTRPLILPSVVNARSARIVIFPTSPQQLLEVGGIEIAGFWEWPGISSREIGIQPRESSFSYLGGADGQDPDGFSPRILNGQLDYMKVGGKTEKVQDFQAANDLDVPFVFVQDYDAPASWPRTTFLARNTSLPPLVGALYRHDQFQFRFTEHLR